jgi:hypothetical protein
MKLKGKELKAVKQEIQELDDLLNLLRENWMTAKPINKERYMKLIDKVLDERFSIMLKRDGKENDQPA